MFLLNKLFSIFKYILFSILSLFLVPSVFADVRINEFLIEPEPQTIELINTGSESADISGWYIDDSGGTTYFTIPDNTLIFPNYCAVFSANLNLNKVSSDTIQLFDKTAPPTSPSAILIDSYSYNKSPGLGISFLRLPDGFGEYSTASASLGLFNEKSLNCIKTQELTPTETITPTNTPTPSPTITQTLIPTPTLSFLIENIYISEVMVSPDNEDEWIELYNNNDFDVEINNWYIDDIENGGSVPKKFSKKIPKKGYEVIELTASVFNNSGDTVRLLDELHNLKDSFTYSSSKKGKTLGRISFEDNIFCLQNPSKNYLNDNCIDEENETNDTESENDLDSITTYLKTTNTQKSQTSKNYLNIKTKNYLAISTFDKPEVLGTTTIIKSSNNKEKLLAKSLSLTSLSYSLLTLLTISLKIKLGV